MKKLIAIIFAGVVLLGTSVSFAQDTDSTTEMVDSTEEVVDTSTEAKKEVLAPKEEVVQEAPAQPEEEKTTHQVIKEKFIEGGVGFMGIVGICLILGLAIAIERIIALNIASTNPEKLLNKVRNALTAGGFESAKEVASKEPGPVGSIFAQGLQRAGQKIEEVEKVIIQYGSVEMAKLEKGMTWISLFIALAPMLGFMGTVIGMIDAFDKIQQAEDIKIDEVAGGIKTALLTTVGGLIVAVILQVFYNYCVSKIDAIVTQMEEASIDFIDTLIEYKEKAGL